MRDLVLDFVGDPAASAGLARLGLDEPITVRGKDLPALGRWGAVRRLRKRRVGTCVTLVSEHRRPRRWLSILLLTLAVPAKRRVVVDRHARELPLSWLGFLRSELPFALRRYRLSRRVRRRVAHDIAALVPGPSRRTVEPRSVVFVRADLGPALTAGGSLAHIQGVVSGFIEHGCPVEVMSPAAVAGIEQREAGLTLVPADERYDLSVELPHLAYNATLFPRLVERLRSGAADLVYQRHALGCFAGAAATRVAGVPLVIEYNGPEVWIARHWGAARRHLELFAEIERRTLQSADLVVAVSEPLLDTLRDAGVPEERILINPNGVDDRRFDPDRYREERREIRARIGADPDRLVAGFVGTFGPWHGAEVLAEAIVRLPPDLAERLRFVFIGDGPGRPRCEQIVAAGGRTECVEFTGLLPYDRTPSWLAACDLLLSPHVPNADASPFFGSPTKLFEYLASGRPVIASDLGQIAAVLQHDRTGWLVPPGDTGALTDAIERLARNPQLRARLGRAGQRHVIEHYTWKAHVERILARLAGGVETAGASR